MKTNIIICYILFLIFICGVNISSQIKYKNLSKDIVNLIEAVTNSTQNNEEVKKIIDKWKINFEIFPIIEKGYVNFLYYSENPKNDIYKVSITGDFNKKSVKDFMIRVGNTNLFYKAVKIKEPDNQQYFFSIYKNKSDSFEERDYFNKNISFDRKPISILRTRDSKYGSIQYLPRLEPNSENITKRNINIYLPPQYFKNIETRYPVIYMQDGQQIWDSKSCSHGGWKMDTITNNLINNGDIEPVIIVGIWNSPKRDDEYMGWSEYHRNNQKEVKKNEDDKELVKQIALDYEDYINNIIKPYVDSNFRTKPEKEYTAIGGASSGAMISLYMGFKYSNIYSKVIALSGGFDYYIDITKFDFYKKESGLKIYLDCGNSDLDAKLLPATIILKDSLINSLDFTENDNLLYYLEEKSGHNEREWSKRVEKFLKFLFAVN